MTTTEQQYERFVKIIVNAFEMKCIEILVGNNCYDNEIDLDDDDGNCEEMENMIDELTETISKDQSFNREWRRYTKLITDDIKQRIIDVCVEAQAERDYLEGFDEVCYVDNFKLLKAFIYYYIVSNSHIVHKQIVNIYKQLH